MSGRAKAAVVTGFALLLTVALWLPGHRHAVAMRQILDRANSDTIAARAAAGGAADSAARARASAQDAWNKTPGGS